MNVKLTEQELLIIQRIIDAALRGSGINILNEAVWLQSKLKSAHDALKIPQKSTDL